MHSSQASCLAGLLIECPFSFILKMSFIILSLCPCANVPHLMQQSWDKDAENSELLPEMVYAERESSNFSVPSPFPSQ